MKVEKISSNIKFNLQVQVILPHIASLTIQSFKLYLLKPVKYPDS